MNGVYYDAPGLDQQYAGMGSIVEIDCLRGREVFIYVLPSWLGDDDVM